ncbi:MAG: PaaI family thioesterase [Bacteroidales bacterium]
MKKIKNKFAEKGFYNCFACSPDNPKGLKMEFWRDGEDVVSYFYPGWYYDGWDGIMHGGIISTLMDEVGAWIIMDAINIDGVTARMNIQFKKPVKTKVDRPGEEEKLEIRGRIAYKKHKLVRIKTELRNKSGQLCSEADIDYIIQSV